MPRQRDFPIQRGVRMSPRTPRRACSMDIDSLSWPTWREKSLNEGLLAIPPAATEVPAKSASLTVRLSKLTESRLRRVAMVFQSSRVWVPLATRSCASSGLWRRASGPGSSGTLCQQKD